MRLQDMVELRGGLCLPDVAKPQVGRLGKFACQSMDLWAIVHKGRTQATLTSEKGAAQSTSRQEKWSRGCRAPRSPFWHFAWLPLWQLAPRKPKKSFTLMTALLSPPSRPTPANTSKTIGRVSRAFRPAPALFISAIGRISGQSGLGPETKSKCAALRDRCRSGQEMTVPSLTGPSLTGPAFLQIAPQLDRTLWLFPSNPPIAGGIGNRASWASRWSVFPAVVLRMTWGQTC